MSLQGLELFYAPPPLPAAFEILRGPKVRDTWHAESQTLEGHSGAFGSAAFSLDGRLLASTSGYDTVKLWDPAAGALQQTLEGHSNTVLSDGRGGEVLRLCFASGCGWAGPSGAAGIDTSV